jgi:hypothetical protein
MDRADEPIQEGTPLNKNTLLSDETISQFGLTEDATPDEAMRFLNARRKEFEREILDIVSSAPQTFVGSYVGTGTSGQKNPTSISFGFQPTLVIINIDGHVPAIYLWGTESFTWGAFSTGGTHTNNVSTTEDDMTFTMSWYVASGSVDASSQLNLSGKTYKYIAFA